MSYLRKLQATWDEWGRIDAMGAVLSRTDMRGKWDTESFMSEGRREVATIIDRADGQGFHVTRGSALDFGCGVGRISQALVSVAGFGSVVGVDIAPSMVAQAERLNQYPDRCRFVLNERPDLRDQPTGGFDLVITAYTLQHMRHELQVAYLHEFARLLRPSGVLIFQTINPSPIERALYAVPPLVNVYFRWKVGGPGSELRSLSSRQTTRVLTEAGLDRVHVWRIDRQNTWYFASRMRDQVPRQV